MDEGKQNTEEIARQIIQLFYEGDITGLSGFYQDTMEWILTPGSRKRILERDEMEHCAKRLALSIHGIIHLDYHTVIRTSSTAVITGSYYLVLRRQYTREGKVPGRVTVVLETIGTGVKIRYIHLSAGLPEQKRYHIKELNEKVYIVREDEIIYLEALHNHVIWHCREITVETVGLLKEAEQTLSDAFLRIHKGFIVHKGHAAEIGRCYVRMDNGDVLKIPEKKYCDIKKKLTAF